MLLLLALPLGVAWGFAGGGNLAALGSLRFRRLPLLLAALALQVAIFSDAIAGLPWAPWVGPWVYLVSLGLVIVAMLANAGLPGGRWLLAGVLCNFAVIAANGGQMPVALSVMEQTRGPAAAAQVADPGRLGNTAPITPETRLAGLGDVLATPPWFPAANVFSVGDLVIAAGAARLIQAGMRPTRSPVARSPWLSSGPARPRGAA